MTGRSSPHWTDRFFEQEFGRLIQSYTRPEATRKEVDFVLQAAGASPGARVLDVCCGMGRHSLELARRGFEVVGIDRSKEYVFEAGQSARAEGLRARFIAMDVRDLPFRDHFDLAISMWTSFGFFDEEANASIIAGIRRSLVPGGKFFIELINRDWLVRNFEPRSWSRIDESLILLEERVFEMRTSVNRCTWYFLEGGQVKETPIELRVYSFHEIVALLRRCGFWRIEGFGDLEGSPVSFDSRMMRVIATAR